MRIPNDFQKFLNSNKERLLEIIDETLLSDNNTSIHRKISFARRTTCKLPLRCYIDDTFTVNHEDADTKLICLVKHANSEDVRELRRCHFHYTINMERH